MTFTPRLTIKQVIAGVRAAEGGGGGGHRYRREEYLLREIPAWQRVWVLSLLGTTKLATIKGTVALWLRLRVRLRVRLWLWHVRNQLCARQITPVGREQLPGAPSWVPFQVWAALSK